EKGFKIIAMEGNFLELYEAHQSFVNTKNYSSFEKAMFSQLNSTEMEELYDFVYEENRAGNPIYFIGFDVAFSGSTFAKRVGEKLINSPVFTEKEKTHFIKLIKKTSNTSLGALFRNPERIKRKLKPYLGKIISEFKTESKSDFFFLQAIQNLSYYFYSLEDVAPINRRDYAMSHNLDFIKNHFEKEKIILFGSSTHLLKAPNNIHRNYWNTRISFGEVLNKKYGKSYHFIAYTSLSGTKYNHFGEPSELPALSENSIEKQVEKKYGDLPIYLRPRDFEAKEPMECRFLGHAFQRCKVWKVFDSLVLIGDVKPVKIKKATDNK
ncbi:MAG: hypothetical protein ACI9YL_001838, partial [Luteibaculaceae bacterium]